ncbi:hypothetical protein IAT40_001560 [Kwoniella sp. CBS 6097]
MPPVVRPKRPSLETKILAEDLGGRRQVKSTERKQGVKSQNPEPFVSSIWHPAVTLQIEPGVTVFRALRRKGDRLVIVKRALGRSVLRVMKEKVLMQESQDHPNILILCESRLDLHAQSVLIEMEGLAWIHRRWIVHHAIEPSSIFIDRHDVWKIGNFAHAVPLIADEVSSDLPVFRQSELEHMNCNPQCAPPDALLDGQYSREYDTWGLGVILAEILLDRPILVFYALFEAWGDSKALASTRYAHYLLSWLGQLPKLLRDLRDAVIYPGLGSGYEELEADDMVMEILAGYGTNGYGELDKHKSSKHFLEC